MTGSRWYRVPRPRPGAGLRLFCFPYAGSGAWVFRDWAEQLPPSIEPVGIELPGRGTRMHEQPRTRLSPLAAELVEALRPMLETPFAFFGHSFGGLLAFEVARELRRRRAPLPVHLLVSATAAPQVHRVQRPTHNLDQPAFLRLLERLNGTPREVLADHVLLERILPSVRADMEAFETYRYVTEAPLTCPISAFGGTRDECVSLPDLREWVAQTTAAFSLHMFPEDHFFVNRLDCGLQRILAEKLGATGTEMSCAQP